MLFQRNGVPPPWPKLYVAVVAGIKSLAIAAMKLMLSVLASPIVMLPPIVKLPVTSKLPVTKVLFCKLVIPLAATTFRGPVRLSTVLPLI
jgi:hypothetical protein